MAFNGECRVRPIKSVGNGEIWPSKIETHEPSAKICLSCYKHETNYSTKFRAIFMGIITFQFVQFQFSHYVKI